MFKSILQTLSLSFLGGICIAIGGIAYLNVGGIAGAILFSFGLVTIVKYGYKLFTGASGFCLNWQNFLELFPILIGNIFGCYIVAQAMIICEQTQLINTASDIVAKHISYNFLQSFIMAIFCGIIMTIAVKWSKHVIVARTFIPLLLGIPLFIMCGFIHSIADAFYIFVSNVPITNDILLYYTSIVLGNFVGCNMHNIFGKWASYPTP